MSAATNCCSTCSRPWAEDEFYENCSECKDCKCQRSRRNRATQARKVAVAERLVDLLALLLVQANTTAKQVKSDEVAV
jgi:hypothetical protein